MQEKFEKLVQPHMMAHGFASEGEYMAAWARLADYLMAAYLDALGSEGAPVDRFRGVVISPKMALEALAGPPVPEEKRIQYLEQRGRLEFHIGARERTSRRPFALTYVKGLLRLSAFEFFYLVLCLLPVYDEKYKQVFCYLQDDITRPYPGCALAYRLYHCVRHTSDLAESCDAIHALRAKFDLYCCVKEGELDPFLADFLLFGGRRTMPYAHLTVAQDKEPLPVFEGCVEQLADALARADERQMVCCISGPLGSGKRTLVKQASASLNMSVIFCDLGQAAQEFDDGGDEWLLSVGRQALLQRAWPCFFGCTEETAVRAARRMSDFSGVVFLLGTQPLHFSPEDDNTVCLKFILPTPDFAEGARLWEYYLTKYGCHALADGAEMANKFHFTPGQIHCAVQDACNQSLATGTLNRQTLYEGTYAQITHSLNEKATLLYTKYNWDQLVLAEEEKQMLRNACNQILYKHIVYRDWGFDKRISYGRGVSMLFAGPPGTGKTMAAQVIAHELDIEIYKVDLSQIVSKYIGETEKNLNSLFHEAGKSNVILLFDETDALLGKRTEVKDSHDKNANLETSYLLQKMEEYEGITIMTTNYLENIDAAFFRRISYVVHFPFPDENARTKLWRSIFPDELPKAADLDYEYLGKKFAIAGGNIKNAAVTAAFLAVQGGMRLEMEHILRALKYELTKQGKILLAEDFGEYGYLL